MPVRVAQEENSREAGSARQRLLEAAAKLFATEGLAGATTREIAHEAGVSEVTLFRLFQSKDKLQSAVLQRVFDTQAQRLRTEPQRPAGDLLSTLRQHARRYENLLTENLPLIRTLIGEIHRHGEHEKRVLHGIFAPLRQRLIASIEQAQRAGAVRAEVQPALAADLLNGMIFTGVIRRGSPHAPREYSAEDYLEECVQTLLRGIAQKRGRPSKK